MVESNAVTIRTRKFMKNPLLCRRQAQIDVIHPGMANIAKKEIEARLAAMYKVDKEAVFTYGFRTVFGGGRSSGFALIYESVDAAKRFEPKHRLAKHGLATVTRVGRKQRKERKNRMKKVRGVAKAKTSSSKK